MELVEFILQKISERKEVARSYVLQGTDNWEEYNKFLGIYTEFKNLERDIMEVKNADARDSLEFEI